MEVTFTGSWYDETAEKEGATKLINDNCVLISQHADSMGAPTACENAGVPNVSYNGSTKAVAPNTFIVSSRIDWTPYFEYAIKATQNGEAIPADWTGTIDTKSVLLTEVNTDVAAAGTVEKIAEEQLRHQQSIAQIHHRHDGEHILDVILGKVELLQYAAVGIQQRHTHHKAQGIHTPHRREPGQILFVDGFIKEGCP